MIFFCVFFIYGGDEHCLCSILQHWRTGWMCCCARWMHNLISLCIIHQMSLINMPVFLLLFHLILISCAVGYALICFSEYIINIVFFFRYSNVLMDCQFVCTKIVVNTNRKRLSFFCCYRIAFASIDSQKPTRSK